MDKNIITYIDMSLQKKGFLPLSEFNIEPDVKFSIDLFGIPKSINTKELLHLKKIIGRDVPIDQSSLKAYDNWRLYVNKEDAQILHDLFFSEIDEYARTHEKAFTQKLINDGLRLQDVVFKSLIKDNLMTKSLFDDVKDFVTTESENIRDKNLEGIFFNLIKDMEGYDHETHIHSLNVSLTALYWAEQISQNHSLFSWVDRELESEYKNGNKKDRNKDFIIDMAVGGFLHDLGKLDIEKEILKKQDRLSEKDFMQIKEHPEKGYQRTKHLPLSKRIRQIILFHHIKYMPSNKSYPQINVSPSELGIMRPANLISICDVTEALISKRAYKSKWTPKNVITHIWNRRELDFYPELVEAFVKLCSKNIMGKFFYEKGDYAWIAEYDNHKRIQSLSLAEIIKENTDVPGKPHIRVLANAINPQQPDNLRINKRLPERDLSKEPLAEMTTLLNSEEKQKMENEGYIGREN